VTGEETEEEEEEEAEVVGGEKVGGGVDKSCCKALGVEGGWRGD